MGFLRSSGAEHREMSTEKEAAVLLMCDSAALNVAQRAKLFDSLGEILRLA